MNAITRYLSGYRIIKQFNKFQSSVIYPAVFAAICVFSSVMGNGVYIPCFWVLTCAVILGLLVNPDTKTFLVPFFIIFYGIGSDPIYLVNSPSKNVWDSVGGASLVQLLIMAGLILSVLFLRLFFNGNFKSLLKLDNHFIFGLLLFSAALLLNGIFSSNVLIKNFW